MSSTHTRPALLAGLSALLLAPLLPAAPTPSPALLVLNKEASELAIVNPRTRGVVARIPTGESPHEACASTDGKLAFVSNYGTGQNPGKTISVIDLAAQKELRRVDLSPMGRPHGIFYAGGKVYFTAEQNKVIGSYDPAANRIDWLQGTGQNSTHMVLVSSDLSRIFTANIGSDSITQMDRGPNPGTWNLTVIPVGKGPEGLDLSPDGRELWTANSRDGSVSIIDPNARKVTQTINAGTKRSNRLKFSPDGKWVFVSDMEGGEIVVIDAPARQSRQRIRLGRGPEGILMTPDGSVAYVAVAGENHIAIIDLKTLEITGLISPGAGPDGMAWAERDARR